MADRSQAFLTCRWCGQVHRAVALRHRERALCVNCGSALARPRLGKDASLAFTVTALILAAAAAEMPLVVVRKFGGEHPSYLWTGIRALWNNGMPLLSVWVALCGIFVPLALLVSLVGVTLSQRRSASTVTPLWRRIGNIMQRWSMPEVQVLAVLVAFVKIGALVDVEPGSGLWLYAGMAVTTLLAWRNADLEEAVS